MTFVASCHGKKTPAHSFTAVGTPTSYSSNLYLCCNPIALTASTRYFFVKQWKPDISSQFLKLTEHLEKHSLETNSELVTAYIPFVHFCLLGTYSPHTLPYSPALSSSRQSSLSASLAFIYPSHSPHTTMISRQPKCLDRIFHKESCFPSHLSKSTLQCCCVTSALTLCQATSTFLKLTIFYRSFSNPQCCRGKLENITGLNTRSLYP